MGIYRTSRACDKSRAYFEECAYAMTVGEYLRKMGSTAIIYLGAIDGSGWVYIDTPNEILDKLSINDELGIANRTIKSFVTLEHGLGVLFEGTEGRTAPGKKLVKTYYDYEEAHPETKKKHQYCDAGLDMLRDAVLTSATLDYIRTEGAPDAPMHDEVREFFSDGGFANVLMYDGNPQDYIESVQRLINKGYAPKIKKYTPPYEPKKKPFADDSIAE